MDNIEQLCVSLANEKNNLTQHSSRIAGAKLEIQQAMNRTQSYFSDQPAAQEIIRLLSIALNDLARADNALYALGSEITTYVADLQK